MGSNKNQWLMLCGGTVLCILLGTGVLHLTTPRPAFRSLSEDTRVVRHDSYKKQTLNTSTDHDPTSSGLSQTGTEWHTNAKITPALSPQPKTTRPSTATRPTYSPPSPAPKTPYTPIIPSDSVSPSAPYRAPGLRDDESPDEISAYKKYGNTVGDVIETAITNMGNQNDILMAFVNDYSKKQSVAHLADEYRELATALDEQSHPSPFAASAKNLSTGYRAVATGLETLAEATQEDIYDQLLAYNKTVETFAESFVPYALLFGALGVTFNQDEPGGIFTPVVQSF